MVAERLGATDVPKSRQAVADYLTAMRTQLVCDGRTREICWILLAAPAPSRAAAPIARLFMHAGIDLLPTWTQQQLGLQQAAWQRPLIRAGVHGLAPVLRWAVRSGAIHRARQRMGLAPR